MDPRRRTAVALTLLLARAVYAYNWYDVGGVLPLIGTQFSIGTIPRGIVLASFLAGAATFQLPAGIAAMRWGNRATSLAALGAMGAFALASAASPNWIVLALLRFGAGAGAAFFFAPALGLVTTYYPSGQRGFMIGAYNAAFSVGAGVGLFASAYLGPKVGWAPTIALGGLLLLAVALIALPLVPATPNELRVPRGRCGAPPGRSCGPGRSGRWRSAAAGCGEGSTSRRSTSWTSRTRSTRPGAWRSPPPPRR